MDLRSSLATLLRENAAACSTLEFSKYIRERLPKDPILLPLDEAEELYGTCVRKHLSLDQSPLLPKMISMLHRSMEYCKGKRDTLGQVGGKPLVSIYPQGLNLLQEVYNLLELPKPDILNPIIYFIKNPPGHETPYEHYWDWTTVPIERIHNSALGPLLTTARTYLIGRYIDHPPTTTVFGAIESPKLPIPVELKDQLTSTITTSKPVSTNRVFDASEINFHKTVLTDQDPEVQYGLFVARKYLQKFDDAVRRNIKFTLKLSELEMLLRKRVCYYSRERLVVNIGENHIRDNIIPDNYLTIDRLDPELGYEVDNVVVCSHRINQLKAKMTEDQFDRVISMYNLMNDMAPDQREAMIAMMQGDIKIA